MSKSYGLIIDERKPADYVLGAFTKLPEEVLQENGDWTDYLPLEEKQNIGLESMACVTFTILNCVEILIKRKYGEERNYSDRFLAAVSGTTKNGNSPQQVAEFLRKVGVVKEDVYPFNASGFDDFYKPLSPKLYELAKEFNEEWDFMHEFVEGKDIDTAITYSPLLISVAAWFNDNGIYYRPKGMKDNHATTYVKSMPDYRLVFDSYDSHLKKVHPGALPMVAKRFWIEKKKTKLSLYQMLCKILSKIFQ